MKEKKKTVTDIIFESQEKAHEVFGTDYPSTANEYNKMSDFIFDYLTSNLPVQITFKDAIASYHSTSNAEIASEQFRSIMEHKFGSKIL